MTAVIEDTTPDTTEVEGDNETAEQKKARERDFSKHTDKHADLAEFVNADEDFVKAGLDKVSPGQVKAILALRTDWGNSPAQAEERAARKAQRDAEAKQYEGKTPEQIKALKAAKRLNEQEAKLQKRIDEARAKAKEFETAAAGNGEDLAALVADKESKPASKKPTVGGKK